MLCSKNYGSSGSNLCDSLARLCRRLCTEYVDPKSLSSLIACRLIPLDKNPGIRPIGIGEVLRRILGKAVTTFIKQDIISSVGPLQLSSGQEGGAEAAIHAMRKVFSEDDCQGVLFVDATNAFNSLNRASSLYNIHKICPEFATYVINTYREPAKLFISNSGGQYILSSEGTTQGDNCASGVYSIGVQPIINILQSIEHTKQIWYADDAGAGGGLESLKQWWDMLLLYGPTYGYFPNAAKT